ncbi:MAG: acyltransferase domain-containing protein, partial [Armatimonadetes bacterium]|nr:acyltransferase domain-containing protein [Armatimonadota bacterium]
MAREPPPPQSLERLLTEAEEAPLFLAGPEAPNAHAVFNGPHAAAEALAAAVRHLEDGARAALVAAADAHGAALLTLRPASDVAPADTIAVLRAVETDTQTLLEQTLPTLGLLDTSLEPGHHDASAPLPTCALHASDTAGHGMAAILRVVLALREKVLPADAGTAAPPFYRLAEPAPWIHGAPHPRRALALFPGLGLLFEEAGGATTSVVAEWPSELVLLSAPTVPDLQRRIVDLRRRLDNDEATLLADLSFTLSTLPPERHRAAILARSVPELKTRLDALAGKLSETATKSSFKTRTGLYYADTAAAPRGKTLWMFPGQGAQYLGMAAEAARCLPSVRDWLDAFAARLDPLGELPATRLLQQPTSDAIKSALLPTLHSLEGGGQVSYVTMLALHDVLDAMAIPCDGMVGYSNGENAALVASGAMRLTREGVLRIMAMLKTQTLDPEVAARMPKGVMLAVSLTTHSILDLVADELSGPDPVYVALDNCPHQLVLFGDEKRIAQVEERLTAVGAMCFRLPFDRAYHTPLFERFLPLLRLAYEGIDLGPGRVPVYSCSTMEPFPDDAPSIFEVAIGQWAQTVRFRETVEKLHARGFRAFVEVGTGGKLLGFVRDTLRDQHDVTGAATTLEGRSDIWTLQELAAQF